MLVAKWGDGLAVKIPADVAEELGIKEGDEVELRVAAAGEPTTATDAERRRQAIATMQRLARPLPPGYVFDREEANAR